MTDCSGVDFDGVRYTFYERRLARIEADQTVRPGLTLLGGLTIGQDFDEAVRFVEVRAGVRLVRTKAHDGRDVAGSAFVLRARTGTAYSIELVAGKDGRLASVVQRVDF